MKGWATIFAFSAAVGLSALTLYHLARSQMAVDMYRERLQVLSDQYGQLRNTYNEAIKKTAVTEIQVQDGQMCVAIRNAEGVTKVVQTPFDPSSEVFFDYVVLDGRLWIRRIFDAKTPPNDAMVIDPQLANVDWSTRGHTVGKAVYRSLAEGRWVVTVTGDGSLGLAPRSEDEAVELAPPPEVRDYEEMEEAIHGEMQRIGPIEVISRLIDPEAR